MSSLILSVPMVLILAIGPLFAFGLAKLSVLDLALWAATTAASTLVAVRVPRMDGKTLWLWIVLALFLTGYFAKTFYAANWLSETGSFEALNPEWLEFDVENLLLGYEATSSAFLAFVLGLLMSVPPTSRDEEASHDAIRLRAALAVLFVVVVALAILRAWLGIGVMGLEPTELPLGIDTAIFRAQSSLIPALLLVVMWSSELRGDVKLSTLSALVLGGHLVAVSAVSASKAGLFYFAAYVLCLWIVSGRLTNVHKIVVAGVAVAAFGLFVLGADLRVLRIEGLSLSEAVEAIQEVGDVSLPARLDVGLRAFFLRISGADGLWFVLGDSGYSLPLLDRWHAIWSTSLRDVFTRDIVDITWLQDFRAPGFVAALVIAFGSAGLACCVWLGPLMAYAWQMLGSLPGGPALRAFSAVFLLQTLMDGIFQWQDFVVFLITIIATSAFARWLVAAPEAPTNDSQGLLSAVRRFALGRKSAE